MSIDGASKKSKTVGVIAGIVAFALAAYGAKQLFEKDVEAELKKAAIGLNKNTPMRIDEFTRLDSATAIGKTDFIYHYTLTNIEPVDISLDTINKYFRPSIIENVKRSPDLKVFRDNNVTMGFNYYDSNGKMVTEIAVTPELYNQKKLINSKD